jgi:alkylresorcinol/alkylpyrone synthase
MGSNGSRAPYRLERAHWNAHLSVRTAYGMPTIRSLQLSRSVDAARQAHFHRDHRSAPCHRTARCRGGRAPCFGTRYSDFKRLARVFESSGIRRRYAVRPLEWYLEPLGWPERNAAYLEGACQLFVDAATKALRDAGITAAEVDTVVTISSTGIATPSLDARVASRIGFRADVERVPVFGLGCAGGVSGFSIASRLAQSRPGTFVLLVAVELCTVAFRLDELTKANIVATALFGDGAAACVLRAGEAGIAAV